MKLMDDRIVAIVADMTPAKWAEAMRRLDAVRRYVEGDTRSADEAARLARDLGIGRSLFYRLARVYEDRAPLDASGNIGPITSHSRNDPDEGVGEAISEAFAQLGPSATQANVMRLASGICRSRDLDPPNRRMIRRALMRELAGTRLDARFGVTTRFAVDRSLLDLVVTADDQPVVAQLTCLIDLHFGDVERRIVTAGPPSPIDIDAFFDRADVSKDVCSSTSDIELRRIILDAANGRDFDAPEPGVWRPGAVGRATLGLRLGRIALLERVPADRLVREPIDLASARVIVEELFQRLDDDRNA